METSSVLLVCILVTCSVWTVRGRSLEVRIDDHDELDELDQLDQLDQLDVEVSAEAGKLPGVCWACKWALNKVKKIVGRKDSAEKMTSKLLSVCNEIGLLKSLCRKFVKKHLGQLIEELTTTDDVRTICVNTKACKPKEFVDLLFYPSNDGIDKLEIN